jgi:hypothetical protein
VLNALLVAGTSNPDGGTHLAGAFHGMADIQAARRTRAPAATPDVPQPHTPSNEPFEPHRAGVGAFYLSNRTTVGDVAQTGLSPSDGGAAGDFHNVDLLA